MFINDFVLNGQPYGQLAEQLAASRFDPGLMRPFFDERMRPCVTVNTGRVKYDSESSSYVPVYEKRLVKDLIDAGVTPLIGNATSLRKEDWLQIDQTVERAARFQLRAWGDLAAANTYGGFNGMGKMILETQSVSDPGEAMMDMDGVSEGRGDALKYQLEAVPLPIIHCDFHISRRELEASRSGGTPFDATMVEAASTRVAETVEKLTIGSMTGLAYGGTGRYDSGLSYTRASQIYGYTNFPARHTTSALRLPTGGGWTPAQTLADVLAMRTTMYNGRFRGPFVIYHSNDWDQYMDTDYILTGGNVATQTLRDRLRAIEGISDVRRLDFLFSSAPVTDQTSASYRGPGGENVTPFPFTLLMVQMTANVARAINGMNITTIQYETHGGMRINFKVMCIMVPNLRADIYGNCGIMHGTATI